MLSLAYPFHVRQEAIEQSFKRRKFDGFLSTFNVPMIAFPVLVIIAQDAFTVHDESQSVLEGMRASRNRVGRCHKTISKKLVSSITVRDFSMSLAFMLFSITTH